MVSIAVLDDEIVYIDQIRKITEACMKQMNTEYEFRGYEKEQDILEDLKKGIYYDLYLLDVQLPDINGLEIARQIRRRYEEPVLIYITNYVDYAVEAFEVNAFRYITKQTLEEKLPQAYQAVKILLEKKKVSDRFYGIERYGNLEKIFHKDIYYLKKDRKYVIFVHKNGKSRVRSTMKEILEELQDERFLAIDRSYVVNINHVQAIKKREMYIKNGDILPVSKPRWPYVRDTFMNGGL